MSEYSGPPILEALRPQLESKRAELGEGFAAKRASLSMPLFASVDIRDASWKVAAIDANAFPAGFNNISPDQRTFLAENMLNWIASEHPDINWLHQYCQQTSPG